MIGPKVLLWPSSGRDPLRGYFTGTLIGGAKSSEPDHPSGVAEPALGLAQELRTPAT